MKSEHLDRIMERHNRSANLQVVFCDIEKYSQRRTLTQISVIDDFTKCLRSSLLEVSKKYVSYAQSNQVNFQTDIVTIPTGDGAALVFSFDGLHDLHLSFALQLLETVYKRRSEVRCEVFDQNGWCNCHNHFNLRVGVSEGKGVIYKDLNDHYNVAGHVINLASRVMNEADRNQIVFTDDSYHQLIDMVDDPKLNEMFFEYKDVRIKHGLKIALYQYCNRDLPFLNSEPPKDIVMKEKMKNIVKDMTAFMPLGLGGMDDLDTDSVREEEMLKMMEGMAGAMKGFKNALGAGLRRVEPDDE